MKEKLKEMLRPKDYKSKIKLYCNTLKIDSLIKRSK